MKKNAFTLIELIVVLVILAVVALIVTPLVLNIVNQSEINARKSSIDGYGKAAEIAVAEHKLEKGSYPIAFEELTIKHDGSEVKCADSIINQDGTIFLSRCKVDGEIVKDSKTEDGYYHYGVLVNDYNVGDKITFNGVDFYVIRPSTSQMEYVTLLKDKAFTYDELLTYGEGHINMYNYKPGEEYYHIPDNVNDYGYMAYFTSSTCGYDGSSWVSDGCTTDYVQSEVKYVVDAWIDNTIKSENLIEDDLGYKARLITYEELTDYLGYDHVNTSTIYPSSNGETPSFVYDSNYGYWTMSQSMDNSSLVFTVMSNGGIYPYGRITETYYASSVNSYAVRPVINLNKKVIKE